MSEHFEYDWETLEPAESVAPDLSDISGADLRLRYERERKRLLALVTLLEHVEQAWEAGPSEAPAIMDFANGALALRFQPTSGGGPSAPSPDIYAELLASAQIELEAIDVLLRLDR